MALAGAVEGHQGRTEEGRLSEDGKLKVVDPETGEFFPAKITVGYIYMIKLAHMVEDKIHMCGLSDHTLS